MKKIKTWKEKSELLDNEIDDLLNYHKDNYSKELILKRFKERLNLSSK